MSNEKNLSVAKQVLLNNVYIVEMMNDDNVKIEDIIFVDEHGTICLSNETGVEVADESCIYDLSWGLEEQFEKAGFSCEAYNAGLFHIYKEGGE